MTKTLDEMIAALPADQQFEIAAEAARLIDEEMTLRDLRKAREFTQKRVAEALNVSQDGVSRIEKRSDFLLSTLRSYVEAMGGKLRLVVEFPDRAPVNLTDLEGLYADSISGRSKAKEDYAPGGPSSTAPGSSPPGSRRRARRG